MESLLRISHWKFNRMNQLSIIWDEKVKHTDVDLAKPFSLGGESLMLSRNTVYVVISTPEIPLFSRFF